MHTEDTPSPQKRVGNKCPAGCTNSSSPPWGDNCGCKTPPKGAPNCVAGAWGDECEKVCPTGQHCTVVGCSERYGSSNIAPKAEQPCQGGYWGPAHVHDSGYYTCDKTCGSVGSHCTNKFACEPNYGGCVAAPKGRAICDDGWYGVKNIAYEDHVFCDQSCPATQHCARAACGVHYGECLPSAL